MVDALESATMEAKPLGTHHQEQIASFLRFAAYKRDQQVKEINVIFDEMIEDRLLEDTYSDSDVRDILDSLCSVVKADMAKELEHNYHTHILVLQQLFKQAEGMDLNFSVDVSQLENQSMLSDLKAFETQDRAEREQAAKLSVVKGSSLASLAKASDASSHVDLIRKNNELQEEIARWKSKFNTLQGQALGIVKEKAALGSEREKLLTQFESMSLEQQQAMLQMQQQNDELSMAKSALGSLESEAAAGLTAQQQLESMKNDLAETKEELKIANDALTGKVDQSKQFQQLKKMIATKNSQLKEVRVRLAKYESDDAPIADD